jgi:exopolysaccharide production protein ExoZ
MQRKGSAGPVGSDTPAPAIQDRRFASIQFLRAFAALSVVVMHEQFYFGDYAKLTGDSLPLMSQLGYFKCFGGAGVYIFFVISGFVMAYLAHREPGQSSLEFARQRITRIVPLYWILTMVALTMIGNVSPGLLVRSLLFIPPQDWTPVLGVGWTLNLEMFFYLVFGLIVVRFKRSIGWIALLFAALNICAALSDNSTVRFYGAPIIWEFFAGLLVFRIYRHPVVARFAWLLTALGVAGLAVSAAIHIAPATWEPTMMLWWGIPAMSLVLGCVALEASGRLRRIWNWPSAQILGAASYSLYLVHPLLLYTANWYVLRWIPGLREAGPDAEVLVLVVTACLAAYLVHVAIEKPLIHLLRRDGPRFVLASRRGG